MRASTMFGLIVAVLLGLGVAVGVKASGLLSPGEPKKEPPPPLVLVAAVNIFEGNCLQAADVKLRPARSGEELDGLRKGDFLPATPQAAVRRFAKVSIPADSPIKKDYLEDLSAPPDLRNRLSKGMRAVNTAIPKEHCDGGMIQVGDWVDVSLTTTVDAPDGGKNPSTATRSAIIARNVRVIAKRNDLWPKATPLGPSCPVNFTLEMDPYRAALFEFVKQKGTLSLQLIPEADKLRLEAHRNEIMADRDGVVPVSFNISDSSEYADEDQRVAGFLSGKTPVSEQDLMRIFDLKYEPPMLQTPPPPATITKISGTDYAGQHAFYPAGYSPKSGVNFTPPNGIAPVGGDVLAVGPGGFVSRETTMKNMAPSSSTPVFNFRPPDSASACATTTRRKN
jgi:Flp pilus assembly protein CpaB